MTGAHCFDVVPDKTGACVMRAWSLLGVCGRLLLALALTPLGSPGLIAGAESCAQAQEAKPPSCDDRLTRGLEPKRVQSVPIRPPPGWKAPPGSDRATVERLFGETERLTHRFEPRRGPTVRISPDANAPAAVPPGRQPAAPQRREFDRAEVERFSREHERLTRGLEPKRMQTVRIRPNADASAHGSTGNTWTPGVTGDFWKPGEFQRMLGR
jgi:hypothetical protein